MKHNQVRLLAQDPLQQLHKPILGLSAWLVGVADNSSDHADSQPIQLDQVAIEKSYTAHAKLPALIGRWPVVCVLIVIAQDPGHPA